MDIATVNWWALALPMALAIGLSILPWTRQHVVSPYITVIHEYGHAVANILTLARPSGIKAHFGNGGGETRSMRRRGPFSAIGTIISGLAGYPAPIVFGLALILSVFGGWSNIMNMVSFILFTIFILLMRNISGFLLAILTAGYFFLAAFAPEAGESMALAAGSVMLVGGIVDMIVLIGYWIKGQSGETDLGILQSQYLLPKFVWLLLMLAGTAAVVLVLVMISFGN